MIICITGKPGSGCAMYLFLCRGARSLIAILSSDEELDLANSIAVHPALQVL